MGALLQKNLLQWPPTDRKHQEGKGGGRAAKACPSHTDGQQTAHLGPLQDQIIPTALAQAFSCPLVLQLDAEGTGRSRSESHQHQAQTQPSRPAPTNSQLSDPLCHSPLME